MATALDAELVDEVDKEEASRDSSGRDGGTSNHAAETSVFVAGHGSCTPTKMAFASQPASAHVDGAVRPPRVTQVTAELNSFYRFISSSSS